MTATVSERQVYALAPLREGANIGTWIGFKHFMYLAEAAVLAWFKDRGLGTDALFGEYGLGLSVADSSVLLPAVLHSDDIVDAAVTGGPARFTVRLAARRPGTPTVLRGRLTMVALRQPDVPSTSPPPDPLGPVVAGDVAELNLAERLDLPAEAGRSAGELLAPPGSGAFCWSWRVPYFYCQYSDRMQHSGYVRALEDVVDRFLASRELSVATLLRDRGWIPVVSKARVTLLADAWMEEIMHTVFTVDEVLKRSSFSARMDCYVRRGDTLTHAATGRILHGYAIARGQGAGQLAELDDATVAALMAR
jgi:acyl-CoA thioesterase FadM